MMTILQELLKLREATGDKDFEKMLGSITSDAALKKERRRVDKHQKEQIEKFKDLIQQYAWEVLDVKKRDYAKPDPNVPIVDLQPLRFTNLTLRPDNRKAFDQYKDAIMKTAKDVFGDALVTNYTSTGAYGNSIHFSIFLKDLSTRKVDTLKVSSAPDWAIKAYK